MPNTDIKVARRCAGFFALMLFFQTLTGVPSALAQEDDDGPEVSLYGLVKSEYIYDSRQVANVREGEFNLYPLPESLVDTNGDGDLDADENATNNLGFFAFFSRIGASVSGPEVLGAEASAVIEADFLGATNENISTFRLRNAYVDLDWGTHEVLFGQYWTPLFAVPVFPSTVNTQAGTPFNPLSRQVQVRLMLKPGDVRVIGVLGAQRDAFQEIGGNKLQQQAGLPGAHLHVRYEPGNEVFGAGIYAKWIRPELTGERFRAGAAQVYGKVATGPFTLAAKGVYGNDLSDHLMLGGFATVQNADADGRPIGAPRYYPTQVFSAWAQASVTKGRILASLFGGYMQQTGIGEDVDVRNTTFNARALGRGEDGSIDYLWRVSPSISYDTGPMRFGFEVEVTTARYTSGLSSDLTPQAVGNEEAVTNVRGITSVFYFF